MSASSCPTTKEDFERTGKDTCDFCHCTWGAHDSIALKQLRLSGGVEGSPRRVSAGGRATVSSGQVSPNTPFGGDGETDSRSPPSALTLAPGGSFRGSSLAQAGILGGTGRPNPLRGKGGDGNLAESSLYSSINSEGVENDNENNDPYNNSGRSSTLEEIEIGIKKGGGGFTALGNTSLTSGGAGVSSLQVCVSQPPPPGTLQPPSSPRVVASAMIPITSTSASTVGLAVVGRSSMVVEWPREDEVFYIFPRYDSTRVLTCQGGGTKIILQELQPAGESGGLSMPGKAHQQWRLLQRGTNATTFYFTPLHAAHLGLDCQNPDRGCYLWDLNDRGGRENPTVLWNVISVPEGGYFIISKPSTQTHLDAFESCRGPGEVTRVGTCSERHCGANQQWRFVPAHIIDGERFIMSGCSSDTTA